MIIFAHLFGYISCVQNRWAKIIVARQQCCSNQNIMVNPKTLEFFKGDEIAASVWTSKYKFGDEETPNDSFKRYVREFAATEKRRLDGIENFGLRLDDLSEYGKSVYGKYLEDSITESDLQAEFLKDVNFNRILLGGSLMQGVGQHHLFSSLSNCLVLGNVHDSYGGISLKTEELAQTMKRRMGAGLNISELRPNGADIHNQATWSSGPILFADRFSYITKEIAQYGRRGALMLNIHINHPDSIAFARHKQDLRNLTGANISVIFDDEFMQAVKRGDTTYFQRYPIDLDVAELDPNDFELNKLVAIESPQDFEDTQCFVKLVNPVEEWKNIIQFAWNTGEPGLLFKNSWREMSTDYMYNQYRPVSTNPCFEGSTPVLTRHGGYMPISHLVNMKVEVWNGTEWSWVEPQVTGRDQQILVISLSDGSEIKCTPYHTWHIWKGLKGFGFGVTKEAKDLKIGDKLVRFELPKVVEIDTPANLRDIDDLTMYQIGYRQADDVINSGIIFNDDSFVIPSKHTLSNRLAWFAGLVDGCKSFKHIYAYSIEYLRKLRLMLNTLGCQPRIRKALDGYQLIIDSNDVARLRDLGFKTKTVNMEAYIASGTKYDSDFVTVTNIEVQREHEHLVYCFTEEKRHTAIFNGLLIGQCSELPMQTYDTCRLCSVNLLSLFDSNSNSLVPDSEIYKIFYNQQRLMDVIVDLDTEYIDRIINKIYTDRNEPDELKTRELSIWFKIKAEALNGRRTGSGFTALGDLFAMMNLQYGSEESLKLAEKIFSLKMRAELDATTDLAVLYGAFKGFDPNLEYPNGTGINKMLRFLKEQYPVEIARMLKFGRRNVSWSTAAPTGSLSMMAQTTSGIEPIFKVFTYRRIKCTKDTDRVDFIDPADGQKFTVYKNIHPQFAFWIERNFNIPVHDTYNKLSEEELQNYFEQSPWYGSESGDIDWLKRVELQSLIQRYTTAAISSTVNLPNDVDVSEVSKIYQAAYERDLKGICVYRDGCRAGVFQTEASTNKDKESKEFVQTRAPKRPERLKAKRYVFTAKGQQNIVYIGLLDSKPFEIFVCEPDRGLTDTPEIEGELIKVGKGHYDFEYKQDEKVINEPDIGRRQINEHYKVSLLLSMALRHGTPLKFVIKTINKTEPLYGTFTIRLIKLLSSFMENGASTGVKCPECGDDYVFENGCYICKSCGNTKC